MSDMDHLRRILDEPAPTPVAREKAREALRARYASPAKPMGRSFTKLALSAVAAASVVLAVVTLQVGRAEAWSPVPEVPPDPFLAASAGGECAESGLGPEAPLLIDQREDVAVALFGGRSPEDATSGFRTCTLAFSDGSWRRVDADDLSFTMAVVSGSVDEQVLGGSVDKVVIDTGARQVEVSHSDGFYLIWWPEDVALTDEPMRFLAPDGSILLELPVRP